MPLFLIFIFLSLSQAQAQTPPDTANDWPMLAYDQRHTGSTPCQANPPFATKWHRDFFDKNKNSEPEVIYDGIQPVVSSAKLYIGTSLGNLYALDINSGNTIWRTRLQGEIMSTAAISGDSIYIGSGRSLYALNKNSGVILWRFETGKATLLSSPIVAGNRVYFGSPDGKFYALNTSDGSLSWKHEVGFPILHPAAFANNKVYFAAQDMKVYALDAATGQQRWVSDKLPGVTFSEHYPVVSNGMFLIRSKPAEYLGSSFYSDGLLAREERMIVNWINGMTDQQYIFCVKGMRDENSVPEWWGRDACFFNPATCDRTKQCFDMRASCTSEECGLEQQRIVNYLNQHPGRQTLFVLDLETGRPRFSHPIPVLYGLSNTTLPPAPFIRKKTDGTEEIYTQVRSFYSNYDVPYVWSVFAGLGKLDTASGMYALFNTVSGADHNSSGLTMIADELNAFSVGGNRLYSKHWYSMSTMDFNLRIPQPVAPPDGPQDLLARVGITNRALPFGVLPFSGHYYTAPVITGKQVCTAFGSVVFCMEGQ